MDTLVASFPSAWCIPVLSIVYSLLFIKLIKSA